MTKLIKDENNLYMISNFKLVLLQKKKKNSTKVTSNTNSGKIN